MKCARCSAKCVQKQRKLAVNGIVDTIYFVCPECHWKSESILKDGTKVIKPEGAK